MLLKKIGLMKQLRLVQALEKENAWRSVAEQFGLDISLHLKGPSAHYLFLALMDLSKTVDDLIDILHDLELHEAASLISEPVKLHISRQPYCGETGDSFWDEDQVLHIQAGGRLHLKIDAVGSPLPTFQWFRDNVPLSSNRELIIPIFRVEMEGLYHCAVQQLEDFGWVKRVISEDVTVKLAIRVHPEIPRISTSFPVESELECGDEFSPRVTVSGNPQPTCTWWHNGKQLEGCVSQVLQISEVNEKHAGNQLEGCMTNMLQIFQVNEKRAGRYECRVKNKYGESCQEFKLEVMKRRPCPTKKMALLIGNKYELIGNKDGLLHTPHNDAWMVKEQLSEYGFECKVLTDISAGSIRTEVKKYFQTLPAGAYALFYFAGHGFRKNNLSYMVGHDVDWAATEKHHVVDEHFVLEVLQEFKPSHIISILDMCQVQGNFNERCDFEEKESNKTWNCNMIQCYSTSQNRAALEELGSQNSVYTKHLLRCLRSNKQMTFVELILKVNKCVSDERPDQVPQVKMLGGLCYKFKLSG